MFHNISTLGGTINITKGPTSTNEEGQACLLR